MRKLKIILICIFCIFFSIDTKALTPNVIMQQGIYGNKVKGAQTYYGQLGYIYLNNKIAYCIEPYKLVGTNYIVDPSVASHFSQADLNYFTLLSYYGYNNTNHNNVYYYMATQELIWRRITGQEVYWTTENVTKGSRINIDRYKNEIITSVNNHNKTVSFNNKIVRGNFRDVVVLEDTNNLLQYYQIENTTPNQVWKNGNKLYIKIMSSKEQTINLKRKFGNGSGNIYYSESGSQSIASFSLNQIHTSSLNVKAVNPYSMKLKINFKNINTKNLVKGSIKFRIKDIENNKYIQNDKIFESNQNGIFESDFYVDEGKYQIEVLEVYPNYLIEGVKKFEIEEDPSREIIEIDDYLDEAKGKIEIQRYFDMTDLKKEIIKVPDVIYDIFAQEDIYDIEENLLFKKDDLVTTIKTNQDGYTISPLLPLGKYYIHEKIEDESIIKDETLYSVELKYKDDKTKEVIEKLDIITKPNQFNWNLDIEEKNINCVNNHCNEKDRKLEDIEYGIFAKKDIIVNEEVVFKKNDKITERKTDQNGKIHEVIPLLKGEYEVQELTDMSKYEEKFENIDFSFEEKRKLDIDLIKTIRKNTNLPILPNTNNPYFKYYVIFFTLLFLGIIKLIYDHKKR